MTTRSDDGPKKKKKTNSGHLLFFFLDWNSTHLPYDWGKYTGILANVIHYLLFLTKSSF